MYTVPHVVARVNKNHLQILEGSSQFHLLKARELYRAKHNTSYMISDSIHFRIIDGMHDRYACM